VGPSLKTGGSWVLKVQQTEERSTGLRVSSPDLFIYTNLSISEQSPLWKLCFHLIFQYIME